jgi:hypothetical protein
MVMSPAGLRPKKDCSGEAQQQLQNTDSTSRQKGRPTSTNPVYCLLPKNNYIKKE